MRLLLISFLLSFMLTNCPTVEDTDIVEMQATVNPEEAGEVNPPTGSYITGKEIIITTSPAGSQWQFTGWTGDTTAQEDSLTFAITRNMNLVANYELPKAFSEQITLADGINSKTLTFGMHPDATAGFDSNIDTELPNMAPPGGFYRRFNIPDYALSEDFRAVQAQQTVWEMEFSSQEGQNITLSWDLSGTAHVGTLVLTDDPQNPAFELDMKTNNSYEVTDTSINTLYIISN
jgi:uncharacterized repeat protein (TIGR02543 family)